MNRLLLIPLLLFSFFAAPQNRRDIIPAKPAYPRLFNDENAYAYYHSQWRKLEDKLVQHQKKTGNQLVILTVATIGNYTIEEIANATFRQWGIGDKETNAGLLVLIARKEKQLRIETGYGLEGDVPDITASAIIRTILKPALDSFDFILPPMHPQRGYLPALERAIDTLISLTREPVAKHSTGTRIKKISSFRNWYMFMIAGLIISAVIIFYWRKRIVVTQKKIIAVNTEVPASNKKRKSRQKRTIRRQYLYPLLILFVIAGATLLLHLKWGYLAAAALFFILRWIYYLPSPKLKEETIAFNKAWDANRKKLKDEYREKKKLLGSEKEYENFEAYMAKYFELGLDKLEKELKVGVFAPAPGKTKNEYDVKSLLYDIFLGTTSTEKKRSFSSNSSAGYSGESTGGQSSGDFGGGSSGGGGANG